MFAHFQNARDQVEAIPEVEALRLPVPLVVIRVQGLVCKPVLMDIDHGILQTVSA